MPLATLPEPLIESLSLVGVGLIGSSIARAARQTGAARRIVICDRDPGALARAEALGLGDAYADSAAEAGRADLVILCVPVGANAAVAQALAPALRPGAIVSDVGSVKTAVVADVAPLLPEGVHFVPGHPVAGTEYSGPDAGFATLFRNRWHILTPPPKTDEAAVARVRALWEAFGAHVEIMSPEHHDLVLAITSHLPHLIAYNIVGTAAELEDSLRAEVLKFSAGGFRDFTRIAASDPTMWRDVFLHNREAVLEMLGRFTEDLTALQRMIRRGDGQGLFDLFTRTRAIRRGIVDMGQETAAPDFGRRSGEDDRAGDIRANSEIKGNWTHEKVYIALVSLGHRKKDAHLKNPYVTLYDQNPNCAVLYSPSSVYGQGPLHLRLDAGSWNQELFDKMKPYISFRYHETKPGGFDEYIVIDWDGFALGLGL